MSNNAAQLMRGPIAARFMQASQLSRLTSTKLLDVVVHGKTNGGRKGEVPSHGQHETLSAPGDLVRPPYAILSHRWCRGEVLFHNMRDRVGRQSLEGWEKLVNCCARARHDGYQYVWMDTCCINKDSDAELTEAINSMFKWYQDSETCYLHLHDVSTRPDFESSDLWTRGWCLQELIAPSRLICLTADWQVLGDRFELAAPIAAATGISIDLLSYTSPLKSFSIAKRMSWAARRSTTRPEDTAYCLLGLFGVYMPLLYGEGAERAFLRLQQTIMEESDDHSLFAWSGMNVKESEWAGMNVKKSCGLLARSPAAFAQCAQIECAVSPRKQHAYSLTNRGLSITLPLVPCAMDTYLAILNCTSSDKATSPSVGIFVQRLPDDSFSRVALEGRDIVYDLREMKALVGPPGKITAESLAQDTAITVRQTREDIIASPHEKVFGFRLSQDLLDFGEMHGPTNWFDDACSYNKTERIVIRKNGLCDDRPIVSLRTSSPRYKIKWINLFLDNSFNPCCFIAEEDELYDTSPARLYGNNTQADPSWTEFDLDLICNMAFAQRTPRCRHGWNTSVQKIDEDQVLRQNRVRKGLWQILGDRKRGLHALLDSDTLRRPGITLMPRVCIDPGWTSDGRRVWDVTIEHLI